MATDAVTIRDNRKKTVKSIINYTFPDKEKHEQQIFFDRQPATASSSHSTKHVKRIACS